MRKENLGQTAKVVATHAALISAFNLDTTVFLHRGETHGSIEVGKPVREVARAGIFLLSGMKPREWVAIHRKHHAETDEPGDPHSPAQNGKFGVLKVLVGNGVHHYRKARKEITPEEIPQHLQPDWKDKLIYDRGWIGNLALFGLFTALHKGNAKRGAASAAGHSLLVHYGSVLAGGGFVNGLLHRGKGDLLTTLTQQPEPFEDRGTYTRNETSPALALLCGEQYHDNHHADPGNRHFYEGPGQGWRDFGGWVADKLIDFNLAKPGTGPRK